MIKFDLSSISNVSNQLIGARSALNDIGRLSRNGMVFTTSPSLNSAFGQHMTFIAGQPGSVTQVTNGLRRDIEWLQEMFESHISAFSLQDKLSAGSFDQMNSYVEFDRSMFKIRQPNRDFKPIHNLMYTQPVSVVEAATPLAALIACLLYTSDAADDAPRV